MAVIRKACEADLDAAALLYEAVHAEEEAGRAVIGWARGVYPTRQTAADAVKREDLFVLEDAHGHVRGAAVINRMQVDCYAGGDWSDDVPGDQVMVLHTLVIDPACGGRGYGKQFVSFYEDYARQHGCSWLRMDTNARNERARKMYKKLGYREAGIVPTVFNDIEGVDLVLLEKKV